MKLDLLKSGNATASTNGIATVVLGPERGGESWEVTRMSVQSTSTAQSQCRIYRNVISSQTLLFDTRAGNSDVASGDPPLKIPQSSLIVVQWSGASIGAVCTVVVEGTLTR